MHAGLCMLSVVVAGKGGCDQGFWVFRSHDASCTMETMAATTHNQLSAASSQATCQQCQLDTVAPMGLSADVNSSNITQSPSHFTHSLSVHPITRTYSPLCCQPCTHLCLRFSAARSLAAASPTPAPAAAATGRPNCPAPTPAICRPACAAAVTFPAVPAAAALPVPCAGAC